MVRSFPQDIPHSHQRNPWDALADIKVFIYAAEAELEAMDRSARACTAAAVITLTLSCAGVFSG